MRGRVTVDNKHRGKHEKEVKFLTPLLDLTLHFDHNNEHKAFSLLL
jgi:hypothetical protein